MSIYDYIVKDTNGNNFLTKVYVSEVITKEYCLENKSFYQFVCVFVFCFKLFMLHHR